MTKGLSRQGAYLTGQRSAVLALETTRELVNIAAGPYLKDQIAEAARGVSVRTMALDDLVAAGDLHPPFVKTDI